MRRTPPLLFRNASILCENLVQIRDGTFYRQHPSAVTDTVNPALFSNLTFELPADTDTKTQQHWAVLGTSGVTTLLEILQGKHICVPPTARNFPYLASTAIERKDHRLRTPSRAIQYVGFNGGKSPGQESGVRGAYLSARYESHREETDWSVLQYLKGETELNPAEKQLGRESKDDTLLNEVIRDLRLDNLVSMPVSNLSNGQTRRARIAKALLGKPELLLLDEPFMGLDPPTLVSLSPILHNLAIRASPRLLIALRPQDPIPDWITHIVVTGVHGTVALQGTKQEVLFRLHRWSDNDGRQTNASQNVAMAMASEMSKAYGPPPREVGHSLTTKGIMPYETYAAAKATKEPRVFERDGRMNPEVLDAASRKRFRRGMSLVLAKHPAQKNVQTPLQIPPIPLSAWLDATALVPDFKLLGMHTELSSAKRISKSAVEPTDSTFHPTTEINSETKKPDNPLIQLSSVVIKYGDKVVLGHPPPQKGYSEPGLNLTIRQGTRLALLGPNGSGKTTFLSLLTSDHPHSYSLPIKFFGRSRLPSVGTPGLSLFEIQSRIGHSSPEIHAFFPKNLNIRQTLESAWAETFSARPKLTHLADEMVDTFLNWWQPELQLEVSTSPGQDFSNKVKAYLPVDASISRINPKHALFRMMERSVPCPFYPNHPWLPIPQPNDKPRYIPNNLDWAESIRFRELSFQKQRLLLLLRAMVKQPDILVLDEAFSGFSPEVRDKAMLWLQYGQMRYQNPVQVQEKRGQPRLQLMEVENKRHIFDALCEHLKLDEEEVMDSYTQPGTASTELRRLRKMLDKGGEFDNEVRSWGVRDLSKSYKFTGLKDTQAMVVVSHIKEEIPGIVNEWIRLPGEEEVLDSGKGVEMGTCPNGEIRTLQGWNKVWGFT